MCTMAINNTTTWLRSETDYPYLQSLGDLISKEQPLGGVQKIYKRSPWFWFVIHHTEKVGTTFAHNSLKVPNCTPRFLCTLVDPRFDHFPANSRAIKLFARQKITFPASNAPSPPLTNSSARKMHLFHPLPCAVQHSAMKSLPATIPHHSPSIQPSFSIRLWAWLLPSLQESLPATIWTIEQQ